MKITQKTLNKVIADARFKVNTPYWKTLIEIGNTDYFITRAREALMQGQYQIAIRLMLLAEASTTSVENVTVKKQHKYNKPKEDDSRKYGP